MLSHTLKSFAIGSAFMAALLLCREVCAATTAANGALRSENGNQHHAIIHPGKGDTAPIPAEVAIEIKHQRTIAMRDIGDILSDLQLAQKNYDRIKELYDEDIAPKKDLDTAESALKRKQIDLMTRRAALKENETAILRKHHLPAPPAPVVTEDDINGVLQQGDSSHSYAEIR